MRSLMRTVLVALTLGSAPLLGLGCATTGAPEPTGPVELDGTRWKLLVSGGTMDGRVVEFKKKGQTGGYIGSLAEPGRRLQNVVGLDIGYVMFTIRRQKENQY